VTKKRHFPWSVLEIDATDDKKTVLKAYAVKLKVTRPEDNAAGFQRLVEARNEALELIKYGVAARDFDEDEAEHAPNSETQEEIDENNDSAFETEIDNEGELNGDIRPESTVSKIAAAVESIFTNTGSSLVSDEVEDVLNQIAQLTIADRNALEFEIIYLLSEHMQQIWTEIQLGNSQTAGSKRSFIRSLDDEYDWTHNDARLAQLGYDSSGEFVDRMRSIISGRPLTARETPPRPWWQSGASWWFLIMILFALARCVNNAKETIPPFQFEDLPSKKPALIEL
jgi:hypothetical protein